MPTPHRSTRRSFARAFVVVPRVLEAEIQAAHGVTMTEYFVLVNLSEAPERQLRMSELAGRGAMSLSAISRVVDGLVRRGLVERMRCPSDRRGGLDLDALAAAVGSFAGGGEDGDPEPCAE